MSPRKGRKRGPEPGMGRDAEDRRKEPHHELNNPVSDPDPTEWPDPYEKRSDPRDPAAVDTAAVPADEEAKRKRDEATGREHRRENSPRAPSTSEPHPPHSFDDVKPYKGGR